MTRQNALNPEAFNTALVPLWDNCNHSVNAVASTDYVVAEEKMDHGYAECHLIKPLKAGDPITINYGKKRILQDLLLHCGFVPDTKNSLENPIRIKLGKFLLSLNSFCNLKRYSLKELARPIDCMLSD